MTMATKAATAAAACVLTALFCGWTAGAQSACADLGGTVDAQQVCRGHIVTTNDLSFPVGYPDQQPLTTPFTTSLGVTPRSPPPGFPDS